MPGLPVTAREWLTEADQRLTEERFPAAIAAYRQVVARDPAHFDAWTRLGFACESIRQYGDAIPAFRQALALRPEAAEVRVNFGKTLFGLGHVSEALREFQHAERDGDEAVRAAAMSNIACLSPGDPTLDNEAVMQTRRRWVAARAAGIRPLRPAWKPGAKLRIGYLSAFFGAKNWMKMFMGVINAHDRARFEVNLISDGDPPSAASGYRDHDEDRIWDVEGVPNDALAGYIADARLDVLIDLNGYSFLSRADLFLHHAAPVQISWANMYATSGFAAVDCLVGDPWTIPPEEERFCVERIRRVPITYLAFDMFYPTPDVVPPPFLTSGHVTFGSLISAYKITGPVVAAWSRILLGVPGARLLLRNRALEHSSNRQDILARFTANGVEAERLILEGGGDHDSFLRTYDRIDIALDAFPYGGGTTTAEAIWQGVPLLTFNGDRWAARTSRSILMAAGLEEYVADDEAGFVAKAIALGQAPEGLAAARVAQRANVAASPACDSAALCRELETIYRSEADAKA